MAKRGGAVAVIALSLAACNSHEVYFGNTTPPARQSLVFNNGREPATIDPALAVGDADAHIIDAMFEGLVQNDPLTTRPMAALATRYNLSADGMRYTFYLRGNPNPRGTRLPNSESLPAEFSHGSHAPPDSIPARWSDGSTITAHDFVYSWRRIADPKTAAYLGDYVSIVKNGRQALSGKMSPEAIGVAALDDFTLQVDLEGPAPYLLALLASEPFRAVPRRAIERARRAGRERRWTEPGNIVTSGPFTLAEWRPYDCLRVRKSPTYYQADLVRLEEIVFQSIDNGAATVNLYRAGATQVMRFSTELTRAVAQRKDFRPSPFSGVMAFSINVAKSPFNNVLLRYALNMAIDKAAIGRFISQPPALGLVQPDSNYPGLQTAAVEIQGRNYDILQYDPGAARELLTLAGYPNGLDAGGRPLHFELLTYNDPTDVNLAQILASQWKGTLHIEAQVRPAEANIVDAEVIAGNYSGLATDSWVADFADPSAMLSPANVIASAGGWTDAQYLAMFQEANRTLDAPRRMEKLVAVEARIMQDMLIIPLTLAQASILRKPYVRALNLDRLNFYSWRYAWIDTGWKP